MRQLLQVVSRAVQQVAQHGYLGGDGGVQRRVYVGREQRRVVRGQRDSRRPGFGIFLRVSSSQREVEAGDALFDKVRKIFRTRDRLLQGNILFAKRRFERGLEMLGQRGIVVHRVRRLVM